MTDSSSLIAQLQAENERLRERINDLESYRLVTEHAWEALIRTDQEFVVLETNPAFKSAFGEASNAIQVELIQQIKATEQIQTRLQADGSWEGTLSYVYETTPYRISTRCIAQHDAEGKISGYLILLLDIRTLYNYSNEIKAMKTVIDRSPNAIIFWRSDGIVTYANPSAHTVLGYEPNTLIGMPISTYVEVTPEKEERIMSRLNSEGMVRSFDVFWHKNGEQIDVDAIAFSLPMQQSNEIWYGAIAIDLREYLSVKAERDQMQEQIINAQNDLLREISTPLIPLATGVVAMPIIGTINTERAQQIMETLLEGISTHQAEMAILDITGVKIMDTQVADALVRVAQAARLLGARVILSGISSEVAQTLVHLEADFNEIITIRNLQEAIGFALKGEAVI
jgi:rsbT co-antagonist protein RsbR